MLISLILREYFLVSSGLRSGVVCGRERRGGE